MKAMSSEGTWVPVDVLEAYTDGLGVILEGGGFAWCADADSPMVAEEAEGGLFRLAPAGAGGFPALPVVWACRSLI